MQRDIEVLCQHLNDLDKVYYRFMAERIDEELRVTRLIIGPQAGWSKYEYNDVVFMAGTEQGPNVASWLRSRIIMASDARSFSLMPMNNSVALSRYPSHSQSGSFILSKPFTLYRVTFSSTILNSEYEFTSEDAPFFLTRSQAEQHLLYDVAEGTTATQMLEAGIYAYLEHTEAWLEKIHFSLTELEIHLSGTSLAGTKLKIVGSGIQGYDGYLTSTPDSIALPLPNGRPDYLKIALIKGNTWLDYYIDEKNFRSNPHNPQRTNVTFAEPEPRERVRELIDRGEGKTIEFKSELPSDNVKWLKTVAAFANGNGGYLIFGVGDEDGSIVGLHPTHGSISRLKDTITSAINDNIDPVPEYEFLDACIDNQDILVIDVKVDMTKCYAMYQNKKAPVYYIRRGATTRVADHNAVQELIRSRSMWLLGNQSSYSPLIGF